MCAVNFLIFVTLQYDDVVAEFYDNKHVSLCSGNDASALQQNFKWEHLVVSMVTRECQAVCTVEGSG